MINYGTPVICLNSVEPVLSIAFRIQTSNSHSAYESQLRRTRELRNSSGATQWACKQLNKLFA